MLRSKWTWVALLGGTLHSTSVRAETAVKLQSCPEILAELAANQACVASFGLKFCSRASPAPTSRCWDFENSLTFNNGFGAWSATGTAFASQPTYGDNVTAWRVLQTQMSAMSAGKTVLEDMNALGGDYWQAPYPIGHQGDYWLGTYENRSAPWAAFDSTQGDGPTGVMTSAEFPIDRTFITFLIGGGCDANTEKLEVQIKIGGVFVPQFIVTGECKELLQRKKLDLTAYMGMTARIVITDASSGSWGHINVDHVLHTNLNPNDMNGANQPLWGFADTHTHPGNHETFGSFTGPRLISGTPESIAPCDGGRHGQYVHKGGLMVTHTLDTESLGQTTAMPEGCEGLQCWFKQGEVEFAVGDKYHDSSHGPQWYTRTQQQMYVDWMKRSYQGGQRLLVATAGNSEAVGAVMRDNHYDKFISDYGAMRRFHFFIKDLVTRYPWMEIAYTPTDARRIIRQNKLAIVLGVEVDDIGDRCAYSITYPSSNWDGGDASTLSTNGANPWNIVKVNQSCGTDLNAWQARIDSLYAAGYRMIIPMHFSNNDLGGNAEYSELHLAATRFATKAFPLVTTSSDVGFRFGEAQRKHNAAAVQYFGQPFDPLAAWKTAELGWCQYSPVGGCITGAGEGGLLLLGPVAAIIAGIMEGTYTPIKIAALMPLPNYNGGGHINNWGLTPTGTAVLGMMKDRGMIIDVAHMSQRARETVLGLGATSSASSLVNPGCDLNTAACQTSAYPVIASHAGLRELALVDADGDDRNEGALRFDMIERIRQIGGTIASGTAGGDSKSVTEATGTIDPATGQPWTGIYSATVANDCAGSSKTFAQGYLYTVRRMRGKGVTIGTDFDGLEGQLNPRFGTMGCYARGNIPRVLQFAHDGVTLIDRNTVNSVHSDWGPPFKYAPAKLNAFGWLGTAGGQRWLQRESLGVGAGLRYAHYNNTPPTGGPGANLKFMGLWDPIDYDLMMRIKNWWQPNQTRFDVTSMRALSSTPPLTALKTSIAMIAGVSNPATDPNARTLDFNYDGLANYGLIPDMLQDTRASGMTREQLGPLFQGAEAVVQAWEKGCRLSSSAVNALGCN